MVVITRSKGQSIIINNDITVVVLEIRGSRVRLGFEAAVEIKPRRHAAEIPEKATQDKLTARDSPAPAKSNPTGSLFARVLKLLGLQKQ